MRAAWLLPLALLACSGGEPAARPTLAPATATTPPATATVAPVTATPSPAIRFTTERGDVHFRTPSGNIGCYLGVAEANSVACDVAQHTWELPPPSEPCEYDWAATLSVAVTGAAKVGACRSDTVLGGERVLAYGTGVRAGQIECVSETRGVTCRSMRSGRGFFVSRDRYRLF